MWTTAIPDLRTLLSDGPDDRFRDKKRCFGLVNGVNTRFKTFEFRRVTDFTQAGTGGVGVFINDQIVPASGIADDNVLTGVFNLVSAPTGEVEVEASYFTQWFKDSELDAFLGTASNWLFSTNDYVNTVPGGLQPSALKYAASEAYLKMAQRWRTFASDDYKVEDAPHEEGKGPVDTYIKMAEEFRGEALKLRDEFYTRQGQALQPLFASISGRVRNLP